MIVSGEEGLFLAALFVAALPATLVGRKLQVFTEHVVSPFVKRNNTVLQNYIEVFTDIFFLRGEVQEWRILERIYRELLQVCNSGRESFFSRPP